MAEEFDMGQMMMPMMGMMMMVMMVSMMGAFVPQPAGDFSNLVASRYWVEPMGIQGGPGSRLPIGDGQKFGGTITFNHRGNGGVFKVGFYCWIDGTEVWAGPVDITLPLDVDWTGYAVEVEGIYDSHGLDHCRLVNVTKVIANEAGVRLFTDNDAECYHNITKPEFRNLYVEEYRSSRGSGVPGTRVPITHGDSFSGRIYFEYRYLGGVYAPGFYLNVNGNKEMAELSGGIELPNAWDWVAVRVDVTSILPYHPYGLSHCRLIDVCKYIRPQGKVPGAADYIADWDAECYHNVGGAAEFDNLEASRYWSWEP